MFGSTIGPYRVIAELGSGGMGTVFRAGGPDGVVALKVVHEHVAATPGFLERFIREGELGKRVRHRNVVATLATGKDDGRHWIALEYVEGQTLRQLLGELGRVPEELCRHVGREVAEGLAALHAAGLVHRDVKPENVLITKDHVVKVMDLGIARGVGDDERMTQTGMFVGSVQYAAPEQFTGGGKGLDGRADLHALGVTLYELATGVQPFEADDVSATLRNVLHETPRRAGEVNPQLSAFFEESLRTLLEKERDKRFASAEALVAALSEGERSPWWHERSKRIRAASRSARRVRIPRETAFHGRDAELALLKARFASAAAGDGQLVVILGEMGIGKSRLVDEFAATLGSDADAAQFLHGAWPPGGAATGPGAFAAAFREHFGDDGIDAAAAHALRAVPLLAPAFAALLRGDPTPAGAEPLAKDTLLTAFVHAARSLAATRPTVLFVDDLDQAPADGRAILAGLANAAPGHRLLIVAAARPGPADAWISQFDGVAHVSRTHLARLADPAVARVLGDVLRARSAMDDLPAQIVRKAGGNPFFLFEIVRGLRDGGVLEPGVDGRLVRSRTSAAVQIPSTLRDMTAARLAGIAAEDRDLLEVASCCGDEFDPLLVGAVLGTARIPLLRQLGRIERAQRLVRSVGMRYAFDHDHVRETLYAGISDPLRREYHTALGEALEAQGATDGARSVDVCGHHLRGTDPRRAMPHLAAALAHLTERSARAQAADLAALALASPGLLAGKERLRALTTQSERLDRLGRRDDERRVLDEALALAESLADPAGASLVHRALGWHLTRTSQYDAAREHLQLALGMVRAAGDRQGEEHATRLLGIASSHLGRYEESCAHYERALAIARELGHRATEAASTINLSIDSFALGRFADARSLAERGLALAKETGERRYEINARSSLLSVSHVLGHYADALASAEETLRLAREVGARGPEATALANVGDVLLALGDTSAAAVCYADSVDLCRELGDRRSEGRHLCQLAAAREQADDASGAETACAEAERVLRALGDPYGTAVVALRLGANHRRHGRHDAARPLLDESLRLATDGDWSDVAVAAALHAAFIPGADPAAAVARFQAVEARLEMAPRMEALHMLWQLTGDIARLAQAKGLLDHLVAHAPPDRRDAMLTNVRLHREIAAAAQAAGL